MHTGHLQPALRTLDDYVEAFEHAWQGPLPPEITDFVPPESHAERKLIVLEMVRADLEFRWQRSLQKPLDQYAIEFPDLFDDEQNLSILAFEEYRVRRLHAEAVSPDMYASEYQIDVSGWPQFEVNSTQRGSADPLKKPPAANGRSEGRSHGVSFPLPGDIVGEFRLQQELGRGAFSRVYLARQKELADRFVVLKLSAEKLAEADTLAQLQHSNIVPIYSQHQFGDLSAVCMPYFGSTTLADLSAAISGSRQLPPSGRAIVDTLTNCAQKTAMIAQSSRSAPAMSSRRRESQKADSVVAPIEPQVTKSETLTAIPKSALSLDACLQAISGLSYVDAVLWLGERLADGLHHAHQRGILHHDLKPANVLLADDGRPMLLDFNLSADIKDSSSRRSLHIGGTLPYMAPEQLTGFMENVPVHDCRSDVYSLGVILFELLTGDMPFPVRQGAIREVIPTMISERRGKLPSIRRINSDVSPATEAIIRKCLQPDAANRYQTAEQLQEDLSRQTKKLPLKHGSEPSLRERLQKWTFRHPRMSATLSVGSLLLLLLSLSAALVERKRFHSVQAEIAELVDAGQSALAVDDPELAQGRFLKAWMLAQGEPALQDQLASFAGWLDHARKATLQKQLKWHVPPRDFETRRDEAFLLTMLAAKDSTRIQHLALEAIDDSLTFATPNDPGWTKEAELLLLARASLVRDLEGPAAALQTLEGSGLEESHELLRLRGELGDPAIQTSATEAARFPADQPRADLLAAIEAARRSEFDQAISRCDAILTREPQQFLARFLHAVCLTLSKRDAEAEVALRACLAQRPDFLWAEYFLCLIRSRTGRSEASAEGLKKILEFSPSPALKFVAESASSASPAPLEGQL